MKLPAIFSRRKPFNLADQNAPSWQARTLAAVQIVQAVGDLKQPFKVVDIGAGDRKLEAALRGTFDLEYMGYDILPQSPSITYLNAETGLPPDLGDLTFALGLLEYLSAPEKVFAQIAANGRYLVFSYVTSDSGHYSPKDLARLTWKTHYSVAQITDLMRQAGLETVKRLDMFPEHYSIWLARPARFS